MIMHLLKIITLVVYFGFGLFIAIKEMIDCRRYPQIIHRRIILAIILVFVSPLLVIIYFLSEFSEWFIDNLEEWAYTVPTKK